MKVSHAISAALVLLVGSSSVFAAAPKRHSEPKPPVVNPIPGEGDDDGQHFSLGDLNYGGTGCAAGTVSGIQTPDGFFAIHTNDFVAAGSNAIERKACGISIPVAVDPGYQVAVLSLDTSGVVDLADGATATLNQEVFVVGQRGEKLTRRFDESQNGEFSLDSGMITNVVWSECGKDTILRTQTSMVLMGNRSRVTNVAGVDRMLLKVIERRCD